MEGSEEDRLLVPSAKPRRRSLRHVMESPTRTKSDSFDKAKGRKKRRQRTMSSRFASPITSPYRESPKRSDESLCLPLTSIVNIKIWNAPLESLPTITNSTGCMKFVGLTDSGDSHVTIQSQIPAIIHAIVEHIRNNDGTTTQGIFRQCGNHDKLTEARQALEAGKLTINKVLEGLDVHTAGDMLKSLLSSLPEPIIPELACFHFENAEQLRRNPPKLKKSNKRIDQIYMDYIIGTMRRLPERNYHVLFYLLDFFAEIIKEKAVTKMDSRNIAMIFAAIFFGMPPVEDSAQFLKENELRCVMLEFFIQFRDSIKGLGTPLEPMDVKKSYKSKQKHQQSLIKGETVFVISRDSQYLYTWVGNCLEIYPLSVLSYLESIQDFFSVQTPRGESNYESHEAPFFASSPTKTKPQDSPHRRKSTGIVYHSQKDAVTPASDK